MEKIIFCARDHKYYKKTYTSEYREMASRERILEKNLAYAERKNNAKNTEDLSRILNGIRRERYKGVIYKEITADSVPGNAKIITFNRAPNAKKYRVIPIEQEK